MGKEYSHLEYLSYCTMRHFKEDALDFYDGFFRDFMREAESRGLLKEAYIFMLTKSIIERTDNLYLKPDESTKDLIQKIEQNYPAGVARETEPEKINKRTIKQIMNQAYFKN